MSQSAKISKKKSKKSRFTLKPTQESSITSVGVKRAKRDKNDSTASLNDKIKEFNQCLGSKTGVSSDGRTLKRAK